VDPVFVGGLEASVGHEGPQLAVAVDPYVATGLIWGVVVV
jgi:hypothetical protein